MTTISWLHLSDWHQRGDEFDRKVVRDALIKDIKLRETRINPQLKKIDFVVFSGDLAFSGNEIEYQLAQKYLLEPLLDVLGLEKNKIFFVPGNHDIHQNSIYEMLPSELQKPLDSDFLVQKWLLDAKKRERLLEPFDAYRNFVSNFSGQGSPDYSTHLQLIIDGKKVCLFGVNSSWMCARNKDVNGRVNDYGYLLVGEPQIHDGLNYMLDADLRIGVMHHPFDWLAEFDRNHIEDNLMRNCHFILSGHQHKQKVNITEGTTGSCVQIPAGASYDRRLSSDPRYTNSYNFSTIELDENKGAVYLRRWSDQRNEWIEDVDSCLEGKFFISKLPNGLVEKKPSRKAKLEKTKTSSKSNKPSKIDTLMEGRLIKAENHYREMMLEVCDIINLANLPEQDRHVVQRQQDLKLRNLFIPLSVHVERKDGEDGEPLEQDFPIEEMEEYKFERNATKIIQADKNRRQIGNRLSASKRLVVLGEPGAGKTTLTRWLATAYLLRLKKDENWASLPAVNTLPDKDLIPIIVRCRELDQNSIKGSLEDILLHMLRKSELGEVESADLRTLLKKRLSDGDALLIIDGLDEITDPIARADFCQQLEKIVLAYPLSFIVATSRIVGYREMGYRLGRGFEHVTLVDLTPDEKDDFASRWCLLTEIPERRDVAIKELIHDIHSSDRIEKLTGNPMLLTTMALVKRKVGKLPSRRAELYWEAVQVLLNWRREVDEPLDSREAIPQLEYVAYAMCDSGVQQLRQDQILDLFTNMRKEYPKIHMVQSRAPEEFLKILEARTGIIVEAGHVRHLGMLIPVYEFRHLTFQEYLAARALVDGRYPNRAPSSSLASQIAPLAGRIKNTKSKSKLRRDEETLVVENWREALRLCVSICNDDDVDDILLAILNPVNDEEKNTVRARSILAAQCLADEPNLSFTLAEKIVEALIKNIESGDGSGSSRSGLDKTIIELATSRWINLVKEKLLVEFLNCSPSVRNRSGGLISMIGSILAPESEEEIAVWQNELIEKLNSQTEEVVIEAALFVMELAFRRKVTNGQQLVKPLLKNLSGNHCVSFSSAWALAWLSGGLRDLAEDKNPVWEPTVEEINIILSVLKNEKSDAYTVRFLTWVIARGKYEEAVEPLKFWLDSQESLVKAAVADALGVINSDKAFEFLVSSLQDNNSDISKKIILIRAMTKSGREIVPSILMPLLNSSDKDLCMTIINSFSKIHNENIVEPLVSLLSTTDKEIQEKIIELFGEIKYSSTVPHLVKLLSATDENIRRISLEALAEFLDDINKQLLSVDLDGMTPFLDPKEIISNSFALQAAEELEVSIEDVRSKYKVLAERFNLKLEWNS